MAGKASTRKKTAKAKRAASARKKTVKFGKAAAARKKPASTTVRRRPAKKATKPAAKPTRNRATTSPPKPHTNAELIVREGFVIDATGRAQQAVPEVSILGNREGFRYLADIFAHLAERAGARSKSTEPAEPLHLSRLEHPVNVRLSDAIEFRFAPLTAANRAATFKRHGITMKSREHGSLFGRYREVAETQFQKVARRIGKRP
jgi:hypothetical protein